MLVIASHDDGRFWVSEQSDIKKLMTLDEVMTLLSIESAPVTSIATSDELNEFWESELTYD